MKSVIDEFGYVIIPKGTLLYRGVNSNTVRDYMFFTTKFFCAKSFGSYVQVWKVKTSIKLPFLLLHLDHLAKGLSAIPQIYNSLFPEDANPNYKELDIKMNTKREVFIEAFRDKLQLKGWFSTIEDNAYAEACIINAENYLEQIDFVHNQDNYYSDSLRKIKLYPSDQFIIKTKKILSTFYNNHYPGKEPYKLYRAKIRAWVLDYVERGEDEKKAKEFYYSLRLRLKI
jgi:hypothetical protein